MQRHHKLFRSFQRVNFQLAMCAYQRQYGRMSQSEKLDNIAAADQRLVNGSQYDMTFIKLNNVTDDMRAWFTICEWLTNGVYTDNTCVYYQRKNQDGQQALDVNTQISKEYDTQLFGYPTYGISRRFIHWPKDRSRETLDAVRGKVDYKLRQWSYMPAILSDIRVWPLKYDLLAKPVVCQPCPEIQSRRCSHC